MNSSTINSNNILKIQNTCTWPPNNMILTFNNSEVLPTCINPTIPSEMIEETSKNTKASSCYELALDGEKYSRMGQYASSISYFMAALFCGTDDPKLLSAIYSQLGNAHFYLKDYLHALEYHKWDLTLARQMKDSLGEAKASGNLGNTLKQLEKFDEAILCCQRHLDIVRTSGDKVSEARAAYNLASAFYAKGKKFCRVESIPSESEALKSPDVRRGMEFYTIPTESKEALKKAIEFYLLNVSIVKELNDRFAEGRAYSNIGNTHYVLGNYEDAFQYYHMRMVIAKEFGNLSAELCTYINMGHCQIFLNSPRKALFNYQNAFKLARRMCDFGAMSLLCFHLGNACTLMGQYLIACVYHLRQIFLAAFRSQNSLHLARGLWSLSNSFLAQFNLLVERVPRNLPQRSLVLDFFLLHVVINAIRYYSIVSKIDSNDPGCKLVTDLLTSVYLKWDRYIKDCDYDKNLLLPVINESSEEFITRMINLAVQSNDKSPDGSIPVALDSENLERETNDVLNMIKTLNEWEHQPIPETNKDLQVSSSAISEDCQSNFEPDSSLLIDDLKTASHPDCVILTLNQTGERCTSYPVSDPSKLLIESYDHEGNRIFTKTNNNNTNSLSNNNLTSSAEPSQTSTSTEDLDRFFSLLVQCQSRRLNEQRCALNTNNTASIPREIPIINNRRIAGIHLNTINSEVRQDYDDDDPETSSLRASVEEDPESTSSVADEAFFDLIAGAQRSRMDDQRTALPVFPGLRLGNGLSSLLSSNGVSHQEQINRITGADELFFDMILQSQGSTRIDSQRTTLPVIHASNAAVRRSVPNTVTRDTGSAESNNDLFLDVLQRLQACRMDEQRSELPEGVVQNYLHTSQPSTNAQAHQEDFFDLLQRVQSSRLDEQRSQPPGLMTQSSMLNVVSSEGQQSENVPSTSTSTKSGSSKNSFLSRIGSGKKKS